MNQDILKGQWQQMRGKIRKQWGKLTDDDLDMIQGNQEILIGKLQERYGRKREEIEKELKVWLEAEEEEIEI